MSLALPRRPTLTLPDWRRALRPVRALGDAYGTARDRIREARAAEAATRTLLDDLAPDWIEHRDDAYVIGANGQETWTRTLVIRRWPARAKPGAWARVLFDLGGDEGGVDVSLAQHSHRLTTKEAKRRLSTQRVVQQSVQQARAERGAISDFDEAADLQSATLLAAQVADDAEALYRVDVSLLLRAPTADALDAATVRLRDRLDALGFVCGGMRWQQAAGFRSAGTPYATPALNRAVTLDTTTLAMSLPFLTTDVGTGSGPLWGITTADKAPLHVDLWDTDAGWQAPHVAIVGLTGAGKTVTVAHLLAEHLTQADPPDMVIVDPEKGDYRRLVRELGGQVVRLGTTTGGVVLNAFDLPPREIKSGTGEVAEQNPVRTQTRLAAGLVALMVADDTAAGAVPRLKKNERAAVETAILAAYAAKGIDPEAPETWDAGPADVPILPDVLRELERQAADGAAEAGPIARTLRAYCTGTLAGLFSRPTTARLDAGLTSFDLEGMDGELRPLAVWAIGNHVWQRAKRDRRRRILVLEEVKTLLEQPESARLVAHLATLARAYGLSLWSGTQFLSDYTVTHDGQRALQASHTVLLMRQAAGDKAAGGVDAAVAHYGLDADAGFLTSCRNGEGVVITPKGAARLQVRPSPWALELAGGPVAATAA